MKKGLITKFDVIQEMIPCCGCGNCTTNKTFMKYLKKNFITKTEHYKRLKNCYNNPLEHKKK